MAATSSKIKLSVPVAKAVRTLTRAAWALLVAWCVRRLGIHLPGDVSAEVQLAVDVAVLTVVSYVLCWMELRPGLIGQIGKALMLWVTTPAEQVVDQTD